MNINEVLETYKSLINVEQAFRSIKTVQLEIRPIFHKTEDRIKAHVFVCMLSYYLLWHMKQALKANNCEYAIDFVLETMKSLQKYNLHIGDVISERVADPTQIQRYIQNMVLKGKV